MPFIKKATYDRKKPTILTIEQKAEIVDYKNKHPGEKAAKIALFFSKKFKVKIDGRSVQNYINSKSKIKSESHTLPKNKSNRPVKYKIIDDALSSYISRINSKGGFIDDFTIITQSKKIAQDNGIEDFKASNGWLQSFKKRHKLSLKPLHGETYCEEPKNHDEFLSQIDEKIRIYGEENFFNMDETGLFYKLIPSKSVCQTARRGYKNFKDRVSIMLCSNMTGSIKHKPMLIGKTKKPRCFKNFTGINLVNYVCSKRAWMTSTIFSDWLDQWNQDLVRFNRKVVLLLDNCPAHKSLKNYSNIELVFLPRNSTGDLQPMDIGIIKSFKSHFNRIKFDKILEMIEGDDGVYESYKKINLADVITFTDMAWEKVSKKVIKNCFKHLKVEKNTDTDFNVNIDEEHLEDYSNYAMFIEKGKILDGLDLKGFNSIEYTENDEIEEEVYEIENSKNINNIGSNESEEEIKETKTPIITHKKSLEAIEELLLYISQREMTPDDYSLYKSLIKKKASIKKEKVVRVQKTLFDLDFKRI